jgi:hypothetical protein
MTDISKIKTWVESSSCKSHWERAVRDYALEMISQCDKKNITSYKQIPNHCNAMNMTDYAIAKDLSEGGCFEVYDVDIAKRLCTPSQLKRVTRKDSTVRDLPHETWIDAQTRAVTQAIFLLRSACFWCSQDKQL